MSDERQTAWPWLVSVAIHLLLVPALLPGWVVAEQPATLATVEPTPVTVRLQAPQGASTGVGPGAVSAVPVSAPSPVQRRPVRPATPQQPAAPPVPAPPPAWVEPPRRTAARRAVVARPPSADVPQAPTAPGGYPVRARSSRTPVSAPAPQADTAAPEQVAGAQPNSGGQGGLVWLVAPVLLKGPQEIPVPEFLQDRAGNFKLTLRCAIGADASSQVSVMEGTGVDALDESVRTAFSGLKWYPGERNSVPVALTVRLTIEGQWEEGKRAVHWGGRVPQPRF